MTRKVGILLIFGVGMTCFTVAISPGGNCRDKPDLKKEGDSKREQRDKRDKRDSKNSKKDSTSWVVSQNTPVNPYASSQTATVDGAIAEVRGGPFTIIVDANNETITFVSHATKLYYQGPFAEWKKRYYPESIKSGRKFLVETKYTKKMFGITAHQAIFTEKRVVEKDLQKLREVWWTSDISLGAGSEYIWVCSGLPVHSGVPLSILRLLPDGRKDPILTTIDIKKAKVSLSPFKPGNGYKKVKSEFELQIGKSEDLNELLGGE